MAGFVDLVPDLSRPEQDLVRVAHQGRPLQCSGELGIEELALSQDVQHVIRADLIRELLLGRRGDLDPRGIQLVGARITGLLDLDSVKTRSRLVLRNCVFDEPIQLRRAHLPYVDLSGCRVDSVCAEGLQVDGDLILSDGFRTTGPVRLSGAHIHGEFYMVGAQLVNESGPALDGDCLQIDSNLELSGGFHATGVGENGAIWLVGARIGGQVRISQTKLINRSGPALCADGMHIADALILRDGFHATGASEHGAIRMTRANIGNFAVTGDVALINHRGPALLADDMRVDGALILRDGFHATGAGEHSTIRIRNTYVGAHLELHDATVEHTTGPVMDIEMTTARSALISAEVVCPTSSTSTKPCPHGRRRINVDHFAYHILGRSTWQQWLHLIRCHTTTYRPDPYQRLAAAERAVGHDGNARQILIAQQHDLHARGDIGGRLAKLTHRLWGLLAGYGYRARRTALALLLAFLLAAALGLSAGQWPTTPGHHAAERTPTSGSPPGTPCTTIEQIGLGIDRGLPLTSAGIRARCDLDTTTTAGQWFTATIWLLQALVWALATLALAAYTNLIRKPN